jgi:prepilin-type processing-associated H-X9-DG protein
LATAYPEFLPDPYIMVCPADADRPDHEYGAEYTPEILADFFNDRAYVYFGYALLNDAGVEAYATAYRKAVAAGEGLGKKDIEPGNPSSGPDPTVLRLRGGIERSFLTDEPNPGDLARISAQIPLLIEWPGHHDRQRMGRTTRGGNVVYLDGHVEFIEYPGKWPMTEKTLRILNELDALGQSALGSNEN